MLTIRSLQARRLGLAITTHVHNVATTTPSSTRTFSLTNAHASTDRTGWGEETYAINYQIPPLPQDNITAFEQAMIEIYGADKYMMEVPKLRMARYVEQAISKRAARAAWAKMIPNFVPRYRDVTYEQHLAQVAQLKKEILSGKFVDSRTHQKLIGQVQQKQTTKGQEKGQEKEEKQQNKEQEKQ